MDTTKIIKGAVSNGRYTVTAPIVKEDYGLYLQIEGVELPPTYQVDFSNSESNGTSVTMIGNSDGVLIPHQFIDTGKDIFAFLYHVGADFGRTVYKFRIPNKLRPDRTDEQPTPEEQSTIDQLIGAMNTAVAQTAQDKADADASAQSASADADRAEEARTDAQNYATQAEQSATDAQESASQASNSATASANSASQSAQIKADVEELVDDAQASADASERSASNAYTYATSAERSSVNASSSAQSASGYASQAQSSANTASAKAQDASQSASTASQKATEAAQSATNASQSAQTAESAKTASQTAQGLAESARDTAVQAKTDAQGYAEDAQASAESISASASQIAQNTANILKAFPTDTVSGAVASFSDGADDIPLKSLIVNIDPVQDTSSGDPSPENICPISGWTQVGVEQRGKNLLKLKDGTYTVARATVTVQNGTITVNGKSISGGRLVRLTDTFLLKAGTYNISHGSNTPTISLYLNRADNNTVVGNVLNPITITEDVEVFAGINLQSATYTEQSITPQLELGSTATDYEPYIGRSITIDLGQTVYGGKLDVLTGILTVYPYYDSYNGETLTGEWISDRDKYVAGTAPTIGAQVVNIGAQGVTVQLEPHEVESLHGVNNLWADSGDTEVEYRANTKLYIERLTAPDSADMIADSNIVSGQYFMVGNSLYKATANIASGSAVIVGTNAIRKSLAQALNEINS